MRGIKFRGKRLDNDEWVDGGLYQTETQAFIITDTWTEGFSKIDRFFVDAEVDPETVGQYTGLKDKNGVEIYEGDKDSHEWIIKYLDGGFWVVDPNTTFLVDHLHMLNRELEIIGNIHDEPKAKNNE